MKAKTLFLTAAIVLGSITVFSSNVKKAETNISTPHENEIPTKFKSQLAAVLPQYLKLKDALVESDESKATEAAKATLNSLKSVNMMLLTGEAHNKWMQYHNEIKSNLNGIVTMDGIEMKRTHFRLVSDGLAKSLKEFDVSFTDPVYVEFCPMANNNKGAYWLSESKDIRNPYFGDKMLKCGSVKDVIK